MKLFQRFNLANEEEVNETTKSSENELVVYAKIGKDEGLEEASYIEDHKQLESRFTTGNRCRTRKITKDGTTSYIYTFKIDKGEEDYHSVDEYSVDVDKEFFEGFKNVSEYMLSKKRYVFNSNSVKLTVGSGSDKETIEIPGVKYEVDVFRSKDGNKYKWCKIDIEVDAILDYLDSKRPDVKDVALRISISHLPFEPTNAILDYDASDEDKAVINDLWDKWKIDLTESSNNHNDDDNDDDDDEREEGEETTEEE